MNVTHEDKIYHFTAYFVLNFLWLLAFIRKSSKSFSLTILISFGIISFGIIVETIQEVLTDIRVFDYYDILANSTGVALSFMAFEFFKKRIMKI
jgi:glycopeptide antibiotics resistance protein